MEGAAKVRASFRLKAFSGALSDEGKKLMARYTSDGTQSQESEKDKRWWENWRDEGGIEGTWRKRWTKKKRQREGKEETKRTHQSMYHSLSLVYKRVPLVHLHRRKLWGTDTEIPATRRSGSSDEESLARVDSLHELAEIENPNKNDDDEELQSDEVAKCARLAAGVRAWTG